MRTLIAAFAILMTVPLSAQPDMAAQYDLTDPGVYAVFETSMGTFVAELFEQEAPITVTNFIELATGQKPWKRVDRAEIVQRLQASGRPQNEWPQMMEDMIEALPEQVGVPLFDGTIFHRVIPGFMNQGGSPTNTGTGGPGFMIPDEFNENLLHNQAGRLSMANSGPNTGGSQFFVTVDPTPWLDFTDPRNRARHGGHAVFGQVIQGMDVVRAINGVPTDENDSPLEDVTLEQVSIVRVDDAAPAAAAAPAASPEAM